jgi:hypothetical protein
MSQGQENRHDYHHRRESDERALAAAAKDPRVAHSHIVMAERHRLFGTSGWVDDTSPDGRQSD